MSSVLDNIVQLVNSRTTRTGLRSASSMDDSVPCSLTLYALVVLAFEIWGERPLSEGVGSRGWGQTSSSGVQGQRVGTGSGDFVLRSSEKMLNYCLNFLGF